MPHLVEKPSTSDSKLPSHAAPTIAKVKEIGKNKVATLRHTLQMPRNKFARLMGRTERAVIDWESGKSTPQGLSQQRLRELERQHTHGKIVLRP